MIKVILALFLKLQLVFKNLLSIFLIIVVDLSAFVF